MESKELRIGNIVNDEDLQPMYISGIWPVNNGKQYNWIDSAGNTGNFSDLSAILLTQELFIKYGFKYEIQFSSTYKWHLYAGGLRIAIYLDNGKYSADYSTWLCNPNTSNGWHVVGQIKYLHQLQNLYYSLTGIELTAKEATNEQ